MPPPAGFVWADEIDEAAESTASTPAASLGPVDPSKISIFPDADAVGAYLVGRVEAAAKAAIAERGHLSCAGGDDDPIEDIAKPYRTGNRQDIRYSVRGSAPGLLGAYPPSAFDASCAPSDRAVSFA